MKNVLVFPCGSEIGLEIHNSLKNSIHFKLYGLSSVNDHGKYIYQNYFGDFPNIESPFFIDNLVKFIDQHKIDIFFPTMDKVIWLVKTNENKIKIPIVTSPKETTEICLSKSKTYELLDKHILTPKIYNIENEDIKFPVFIKPDIGYGSRGTKLINSKEEIQNINMEGNLICEYLPGDEYTIDCFSDFNRELKFIGARERKRISNGISVNTATSKLLSQEFRNIAEIINKHINLRGAWFFQVKKNVIGKPVLLEVASRLAGSSSVHRIQGVNFALLSLFDIMGIQTNIVLNNFNITLDRALDNKFKIDIQYDKLYIDYDDTLIVNNKINIEAVSLIYYCKNNNIRVILLTKHSGNLKENLNKYYLSSLFDKILHLQADDHKYKYIDIENSRPIFIDDSHQERKEVHDKLHIPVFGIDAINSLY